MSDQKNIIPYHEANIQQMSGVFKCSTIELSEGRSVMVGYNSEGKRLLIIERPCGDKRSQLKFGLSNDASLALLQLLAETFRKEQLGAETKENQ